MKKIVFRERFEFEKVGGRQLASGCAIGTMIAPMSYLKIQTKQTGVKKGAFSHLFTNQSQNIFGFTVQKFHSDE